jgi:hypothetical protein
MEPARSGRRDEPASRTIQGLDGPVRPKPSDLAAIPLPVIPALLTGYLKVAAQDCAGIALKFSFRDPPAARAPAATP